MSRRRKRERALIPLCCSLLVFASCTSQNNSPATNSAPTEAIVSTPPFQTKEPEHYRATRTIITVTADGKTTVAKSSTAKDGEMRRTETEVASRTLVFLNLPEGTFILLPDEKVYANTSSDEPVPGSAGDGELTPEKLLHDDIGSTSYQKLGAESIAGRNTNKYRVVVNSSNAASVSQVETLIWIDEALGMPIRSETKSPDGTHVTMELSEIELDIDRNLFEIPNNYKRVTVGVALRGHPTLRAP
jgi:outer membrane lipoprotein-sorting protein